MSGNLLEVSKNANPDYIMMQEPITKEELELDLELEPTVESEQEAGLDLELDLTHGIEPESDLEPESELEPEIELEPELEPEPEPEAELEAELKPRPRAHTYPWQQYWSLYPSTLPRSPVQARCGTPSLERRRQHMNLYSPKDNNTEDC